MTLPPPPRFQRLPFTWLLGFVLGGAVKQQPSPPAHISDTVLRGFKDPPEVNTHMVGRPVCLSGRMKHS